MSRLLILIMACFVFACSSAKSRGAEPVEPSPPFPELVEKAKSLRQSGNTDIREYKKLTRNLDWLIKKEPWVLEDEKNRKLAEELLRSYPTVTCNFSVTEPDEKLTTSKGSASPLIVTGTCPVSAPFLFEADSLDMALAADSIAFSEGKMSALVRVNSATPTKEKNKVKFSARYYASEFLGNVATAFKLTASYGLVVNPPEYQLTRDPVVTTDTYADLRRSFRKTALTSEAATENLGSEVAISETGQFTIGGSHSARKFDLLYGHPNGELPDGIGTSFTTIRIDSADYRLEEQVGTSSKTPEGALVTKTKIAETGITVTQTLKPQATGDRVLTHISYSILNESNKSKKVGVRLLLDTWAGHDDGVPFLLPIGESKQLYRTEVEFTPSASLMWQVYDVNRVGKTANEIEPALQNILVGKDLVPPDRVALANWPEAAETLWDYAVRPDRRITGDSAVVLWWEPSEVAAGDTQTVATDLGAFLDRHEPTVFVTNPDNGDLIVYLWHYNAGKTPESVSYSVRATNGDLAYTSERDSATLEPGDAFVKANSAQIIAEGDSTIIITEKIGDVTKEYKFPLANLKQWKKFRMAPVVEPSKNFPVSYFDTQEMELKARLKTSGGKIIKTIPLTRKKIEGGYEYTGNFEIPVDADPGRYTVEVVK